MACQTPPYRGLCGMGEAEARQLAAMEEDVAKLSTAYVDVCSAHSEAQAAVGGLRKELADVKLRLAAAERDVELLQGRLAAGRDARQVADDLVVLAAEHARLQEREAGKAEVDALMIKYNELRREREVADGARRTLEAAHRNCGKDMERVRHIHSQQLAAIEAGRERLVFELKQAVEAAAHEKTTALQATAAAAEADSKASSLARENVRLQAEVTSLRAQLEAAVATTEPPLN